MAFILFDTDGVVIDYFGCERPGIRDLMVGFTKMGYEIRMWSGAGREHAAEVAQQFNLPCTSFTTKPDYPMNRDVVSDVLDGTPTLQFDDDATEYVGEWPFILVDCEYGTMPGRTKKVA